MIINEISEDQIAELKKQHKYLTQAIIELQEDGQDANEKQEAIMIFTRPKMRTISAMAKLEITDPMRALQTLANDTLVFGDAKLLTDPYIFQGLIPALKEVNQKAKVRVGKL